MTLTSLAPTSSPARGGARQAELRLAYPLNQVLEKRKLSQADAPLPKGRSDQRRRALTSTITGYAGP